LKWFQHQSRANRDTKLKKVLIRYGAEGYGLYWYCIEHICDSLEPRLTFELEHDCEILAHELRIDTLKVEEMMRYMVQLGLFEESEGVITCMKLASHLGDNLTRNPALKAIIKRSKSETVSDNRRLLQQEERRGQERKGDNKKNTARKRAIPPEFEVDDSMIDWVTEKYPLLDYKNATDKWLDYIHREGKKYADWKRAWMGGMRKADEWRSENAAKIKNSTRDSDIHEDLTDTSWAH